ncbi:MAG: CoA pyrophosphatase [Deltaproteobacteria bacterium]|nr:CoA pyrophosphatase [Deltaproteobacteria bacterium]
MEWEQQLRESLKRSGHYYEQERKDPLSSVLIPIGQAQPGEPPSILLTKRSMHVETHKGHVSFPGGFVKAADRDLYQTALRECEEEVGLRRQDVDLIGRLDPVATREKDILICPWIGKFVLPYSFRINEVEVEKIFFLPLDRLIQEGLRPVNVKVGSLVFQSIGISVDGELVWGATARILKQLRELFS